MSTQQVSIVLLFHFFCFNLFAQNEDSIPKPQYITTGTGIYATLGEKGEGIGIVYTLGYQWTLDKKQKKRLSTSITKGNYFPIFLTGTRDQYFSVTTFDATLHFDLIQFKSLSLVVSPGVFAGYSFGLLGTGGDDGGFTRSDYLFSFYGGGKLSLGLRIAPKHKRVAYELRYGNLHIGYKNFTSGGLLFGIDIQLNKKHQ